LGVDNGYYWYPLACSQTRSLGLASYFYFIFLLFYIIPFLFFEGGFWGKKKKKISHLFIFILGVSYDVYFDKF